MGVVLSNHSLQKLQCRHVWHDVDGANRGTAKAQSAHAYGCSNVRLLALRARRHRSRDRKGAQPHLGGRQAAEGQECVWVWRHSQATRRAALAVRALQLQSKTLPNTHTTTPAQPWSQAHKHTLHCEPTRRRAHHNNEAGGTPLQTSGVDEGQARQAQRDHGHTGNERK